MFFELPNSCTEPPFFNSPVAKQEFITKHVFEDPHFPPNSKPALLFFPSGYCNDATPSAERVPQYTRGMGSLQAFAVRTEQLTIW